MKFLSAAVAAAAAVTFAATPVSAATVPLLLNFEAATGFAPIDSLYASAGIRFGGDALGLVNDALGNYFSNAPTAVGVMTPVGLDSAMNVANGFVGSFSFFYSSLAAVNDGVQVWSGFDGTGSLLATFDLAANAQAGGCSDTALCNFNSLSAAFAGTARSVTFGNATYSAVFDNVAITAVPEPTSALLVPLALFGLLATRRRA